MRKPIGPIGMSVAESIRRDAARSALYRREMKRLEPYERIARAVIRLRMREHLTQAQLATRIGTTASAICRLESGQHAPSLTTLRRLAAAVGGRLVIGFEIPGIRGAKRERIAI